MRSNLTRGFNFLTPTLLERRRYVASDWHELQDVLIRQKAQVKDLYLQAVSEIDWHTFETDYLIAERKLQKDYARGIRNHAKKYYDYFLSPDVIHFTARKKIDVIKSISQICRCLDSQLSTVYFHDLHLRYLKSKNIGWTAPTEYTTRVKLALLKQYPVQKIFELFSTLDPKYSLFCKFMFITGLRSSEAIRAINDHDSFCNGRTLELYWDRKTKKANEVYCHPVLHHSIQENHFHYSVGRVNKMVRMPFQLKFLRTVNATLVYNELQDIRFCDFMQGRNGDLTQKRYYLPSFKQHHERWLSIWKEFL